METYRLKNIAIVILLLLNGCLLLTVGFQELQSLRAERRVEDRLRELYRASQLALGEDLDLSRQSLGALTPSRHAETERAIAAALLGGEPAAASQGGGIYSYEAEHGVIQFRSGGSFYGTRPCRWRISRGSRRSSAAVSAMKRLCASWKTAEA